MQKLRDTENTIAKLVSAYKKLVDARTATVGRLMSETEEDKARLDEVEQFYSSLKLNSSIRRSKMHDSFIRAFRKDLHNGIREILVQIDRVRRTYTVQTHRREQYGIIPPVAFCAENELPWYLGDTNVKCDFELAWTVQFEQFYFDDTDLGVLEALGISHSGLIYWWTGGLEVDTQASLVWRDVRNLAHKMVYLLDKTNKIANEWFSLPAVLLPDWESQSKIDEIIVPSLKLICQGIFQLLFKYQEEYLKDRLLTNTAAYRTVYAFCHIIHVSTEEWQEMGAQATDVLEKYINILMDDFEDLVADLGTENEISAYDMTDFNNLKNSIQSGRDGSRYATQAQILSLRDQAAQRLRTLGLRELNVTVMTDDSIGSGSYARVYKCRVNNSSKMLAAKFLKFDQSNPARIVNRLLREATCWNMLKHANINLFHGFCVDPISQLPGLVSDYCCLSLADYMTSLEYNLKKTKEHISLLYEISSGLAYMHQHKDKIAHGDVRPENILLVPRHLGSGYSALLSDFGISYVDDVLTDIELSSRQCTNYFYIAPELLSEESKTKKRMVSTEGDIYAFGCVFLYVMYRLAPFYFVNEHLLAAKRMRYPSLLPAPKKRIKNDHWKFLERTWSIKPAKRPKADEVMLCMDMFKLSNE